MAIIIELESSYMRLPFRLIGWKRLSQLRPQHQFKNPTKAGDWKMQVENRNDEPLPKEGKQWTPPAVAKKKMTSTIDMSSYLVEGTGPEDRDGIGIDDVEINPLHTRS